MKKNKSQKNAAIKAAIVNQIKSLAVPVILCAVICILKHHIRLYGINV